MASSVVKSSIIGCDRWYKTILSLKRLKILFRKIRKLSRKVVNILHCIDAGRGPIRGKIATCDWVGGCQYDLFSRQRSCQGHRFEVWSPLKRDGVTRFSTPVLWIKKTLPEPLLNRLNKCFANFFFVFAKILAKSHVCIVNDYVDTVLA